MPPGELIDIDIFGKLPRSTDNKLFILTIIDDYFRFLEAIPLYNTNTKTIVRKINQYFSQYGIPKIVLSDNSSYFTLQEFKTF